MMQATRLKTTVLNMLKAQSVLDGQSLRTMADSSGERQKLI